MSENQDDSKIDDAAGPGAAEGIPLQPFARLVNYESLEGGSDTPDFILAGFLADCLAAWNTAVRRREEWHGRKVGVEDE